MRLYHFTCDHGMARILKEGITRGFVIRNISRGQAIMVSGYVWLTTEPDPAKQPWCAQGRDRTLSCNRLEFRFAVDVPEGEEKNVLTWAEVRREARVNHETAEILEACGGSEAWRLFRGRIPVGWLSWGSE